MRHIRHIERQATEANRAQCQRSVKRDELTFIWLHAHARDRQQFDKKVRGNFKFNGFLISSYAWRKSIVRLRDRAWHGCSNIYWILPGDVVTETEDMAIDEGLYGNDACWFIKLRNWYSFHWHWDMTRCEIPWDFLLTLELFFCRWIDGGCYWAYSNM